MNTAGEIFGVIKKIMLVSEELTRQGEELKRVASKLEEHGERLIRIETTLTLPLKRVILFFLENKAAFLLT